MLGSYRGARVRRLRERRRSLGVFDLGGLKVSDCFKMAPSLFEASRRRKFLLGTAIAENLLFSFILFGWGSLVLMLKAQGLYSKLCTGPDGNNTVTAAPALFEQKEDKQQVLFDELSGCDAQDRRLNLAFTVGSFLLSGMTFPIGIAMDKFGCRSLRMIGCLLVAVSCLLFAWSDRDMSDLLFLAVIFNGVGGTIMVYTSLQVSNFFGHARSTILSVMMGSSASSAIVFPVMKAIFDLGVSFRVMMMVMAAGSLLAFVNCVINYPSEPVPGPETMDFTIHTGLLFGRQNKISGKNFYSMVTTVGRRLSVGHSLKESETYTSKLALDYGGNVDAANGAGASAFRRAVCTFAFLGAAMVMSITHLRLMVFIGTLSELLQGLTQDAKIIDVYTYIFGLVQICCLISAPVIGALMDWKTQPPENSQPEDDVFADDQSIASAETVRTSSTTTSSTGSTSSRPSIRSSISLTEEEKARIMVQKVWNAAMAFFLTNLLTLLFGVLVLVPNLVVQVATFVLHTVIRAFMHTATAGLFAIMFQVSLFGSLIGLQAFFHAAFATLQYPLFIAVNGPLSGDPFWINVGLLVASLLNFALPVYLLRKSKEMEKELSWEEDMKILPPIPTEISIPIEKSVAYV
ncbi:large neutral amino acids transporter small subunit 4-like isoform X1 [Branchiostoma floridae]|uniref:Large neutral amino acids transporter small subunit 4-like isoform X1 n=2 Tax=Branchiostoma floridae TaxID=7739 RepID=A0A9J7HJE1_BRAFL|nr:large neutral amino acids transporter small subunit 4-like isoform X1 [Branchiostoma floridae]